MSDTFEQHPALQWLIENEDSLREPFNFMWCAISAQGLVDADPDLGVLIDRYGEAAEHGDVIYHQINFDIDLGQQ